VEPVPLELWAAESLPPLEAAVLRRTRA